MRSRIRSKKFEGLSIDGKVGLEEQQGKRRSEHERPYMEVWAGPQTKQGLRSAEDRLCTQAIAVAIGEPDARTGPVGPFHLRTFIRGKVCPGPSSAAR